MNRLSSGFKRLGVGSAAVVSLCAVGTAMSYTTPQTNSDEVVKADKEYLVSNYKVVRNVKAKAPEAAQGYLLLGKSAFDEEGENIFSQGGQLRKYSTDVTFNDETGKVSIEGIVNSGPYAEICGAAVFDWDKDEHIISAATPDYFQSVDNTVCLIEFEGGALTLNAGEMYGMGYWRTLPEMVMKVNDDRSVIEFQSAYAITENVYDERNEQYSRTGLASVMFDVNLYREGEGPLVYASDNNLVYDQCFNGEAVSKTILLVNPGSEDADYAVSISSDAFSVSQKFGVIESGDFTELTITFAPESVGDFDGTISVMGEQNIAKIHVSGSAQEKPDYSSIVSSGKEYLSFNTDNKYPFVISEEYGDKTVAVSTNKAVANSESWLDVSFTVPEGNRANLTAQGYFYPRYAAYDYFVVKNGEETLYETPDNQQFHGAIDQAYSFVPGDYTIRFCYEKGSQPNVPSVVMGEDYVYLSNIALELRDYLPNEAIITEESCDFGKLYTMNTSVEVGKVITDASALKNTGYENLIINSIDNSEHFAVSIDAQEIAPDKQTAISVIFSALLPDVYSEDIVFHTNAGDFTLNCTAEVLAAPDYQSIVKEGEFVFEMGIVPFLVEDGRMFNDPNLPNDGVKITSETSARFEIPEDKCGLLTWEGYADCGDGDEAMIMIDQNIFQMLRFTGFTDASSYKAKPTQCWLAPGEHLISFGFTHSGNSTYEGEGVLSISNLSLQLFDEAPAVVIWEPLPIEFKPMYPGYTDTRNISLYNIDFTKERIVTVEDVWCSDGFMSNFDSEAQFTINPMGSRDVELAFTPSGVGEFSGVVTLHTDHGDIEVPLKGEGKDDSKLLFYEDFENGLDAWSIIDGNQDDNTWKIAPASMAYTGKAALQFNSFFSSGDSEDYIISPEIEIPADGAELHYFRAYNANNEAHEYAVLVGEGDDPAFYEKVNVEDNFSREFEEIVIDLNQFAGKTVRICFANTTPADKKNILKIDELSIISRNPVSVEINVAHQNGVKEYFNLEGQKVTYPSDGIYIVKETFSDGSVKVTKEIKR